MPEKIEVSVNEELNTLEFHISRDYVQEVLNIDENNTELWAVFGKAVRDNILRNNKLRLCVDGAKN